MAEGGAVMALHVGVGVPVPVGREVLDALESVTVTAGTDGPGGFQLRFDVATDSPVTTLFLATSGASPLPLVRVVVAVRLAGASEVLVDGVVVRHEFAKGDGPGRMTLTVTGEDLGRMMDFLDASGVQYPAMPDFARVTLILAKYAGLGVIPKVIPSVFVDVPLPTERIPAQIGTDLAYIRALADRAGYVFYLEPGPGVGTSVAYWGPEAKLGAPQKALSVDMDHGSNVEDLTFSYEGDRATLPIVLVQNRETRATIPLPVPPITPLSPPLTAVPAIPRRVDPIRETAKYDPVQGVAVGLAKAARTAQVAAAEGTLEVARYGAVLRPRKLVGLRGAGLAFDGHWYVESVTTTLARGRLTQDFTLSRNGLVSTVDKVPA